MGKVRNASRILLGNPDIINNCVWPKMAHARDKRRIYVNRERKRVPKFYTRRAISQVVGNQIKWFLNKYYYYMFRSRVTANFMNTFHIPRSLYEFR